MGSGVEVPVPSLRWRALVVLFLLIGFYLATFVLSATLFVLPIAFIYFGGFHGWVNIIAFIASWAPAFVILMAALGARPPKFSPEGIELFPSQNPALFTLIEEVAAKAGTAPPTQVFLQVWPIFGVVETGGLFARKRGRVLLLGAPIMRGITVEQLRAILAHEMGHFIGGDTRLSGVISYAHQAFAAVYEASVKRGPDSDSAYGNLATEATHVIGTNYVRLYMRLFLALTRPTSRKQEIAADALSVRLAGRAAATTALERTNVLMPMYRAYIDGEVRPAMKAGAAPSDLLEGFDMFCAKIAERGLDAKVTELVRAEKTDPFDSHPAYTERVAMMETFAEGERDEVPNGSKLASELIELDGEKLRTWLLDCLIDELGHGRNLPRLKWRSIVKKKLPAKIAKDAKELVQMLERHFPRAKGTAQIFHAAVGSLADGSFVHLAHRIAPDIARVHREVRAGVVQSLGAHVLACLFEATLLEHGAVIELSLGEPSLVFVLEGERILAGDLAGRAMSESAAAAEVSSWAERLLAPPPKVEDTASA